MGSNLMMLATHETRGDDHSRGNPPTHSKPQAPSEESQERYAVGLLLAHFRIHGAFCTLREIAEFLAKSFRQVR